jgi:hypothetical protein
MGDVAAQDPVSRLAAVLSDLYDAAGRPPHSELKRQGEAQDPEVTLPSSTLNDWLRGKTSPTDRRVFQWLVDYLKNKARRRGSDYVAPPQATWDRLREQALKHRRAGRGGRPARGRGADDAVARLPGITAVPAPGPLVRKVTNWDPYVLGVKKSARAYSPQHGLPAYVVRDHDPELREAIEGMRAAGGFLVLVGEPASGKSRSVYEALRAVAPEWQMVQPRLPADLARVTAGHAPNRVVWLDDMSRLLGAAHDGLAGEFAALLASREPVVILGTLWPRSYDHYAGLDGAADAAEYASSLPPAPSVTSEILGLAQVILVGSELSSSELERAEEAAACDSQLSDALASDEFGLFQTLAGTRELLRRWLTGDPAGRAVITAAVDARLLGATEPLAQQYLTEAAPGYLPPGDLARLTPAWAGAALRYATTSLEGAVVALPRVPGATPGTVAGYGPADILVRAGQERRRFSRVPDSTWRALLAHVSDVPSLMRIGWSAQWRLLYDLAHQFYLAAGPDGMVSHARLLIQQGRADEARRLLSPLAETGDQGALDALRLLARDKDDPDKRAADLQRLAPLSAQAAADLARELESQGLIDEAIHAWSALADKGDTRAATRAAKLLASSGQHDQAVTLLRSSACDDNSSRSTLVDLLIRTGKADEAEALLRIWADSGDDPAARRLAELLREAAREEDLTALAEDGNWAARSILLTQWADGGRRKAALADKAVAAAKRWHGYWGVYGVLEELGRKDEALDVLLEYERDHEPNDDLNAVISGALLEKGRTGELQARADSGDSRAQELIARQLADQNDLDGLAGLARQGYYAACVHLSRLLADQGQIDEAIAVWRRTAAGDKDRLSRWELIDILRKYGRHHELLALVKDEPVGCGKRAGRALASALIGTGKISALKDRADAGDRYADEALAGYLADEGSWAEVRQRAASGSGAATRALLSNDTEVPEHREISTYGLHPDGSIALPGT